MRFILLIISILFITGCNSYREHDNLSNFDSHPLMMPLNKATPNVFFVEDNQFYIWRYNF